MKTYVLRFLAHPPNGREPIDVLADAVQAVDALTIVEKYAIPGGDRVRPHALPEVQIRFLGLNGYEAAATARSAISAAQRLGTAVDSVSLREVGGGPVPVEEAAR